MLGLEEMRVASEAGEEEGQGRGFKDTSSADSYSHSQALGSTPCPGNAGREGILEAAAKVTPHPTPAPDILKILRSGRRKEINFPSSLTDFDLSSFKG